jgi:hypothetical protein
MARASPRGGFQRSEMAPRDVARDDAGEKERFLITGEDGTGSGKRATLEM